MLAGPMHTFVLADLQEQIDSLRAVVAKQDTAVRNLAALAGGPFPP